MNEGVMRRGGDEEREMAQSAERNAAVSCEL